MSKITITDDLGHFSLCELCQEDAVRNIIFTDSADNSKSIRLCTEHFNILATSINEENKEFFIKG